MSTKSLTFSRGPHRFAVEGGSSPLNPDPMPVDAEDRFNPEKHDGGRVSDPAAGKEAFRAALNRCRFKNEEAPPPRLPSPGSRTMRPERGVARTARCHAAVAAAPRRARNEAGASAWASLRVHCLAAGVCQVSCSQLHLSSRPITAQEFRPVAIPSSTSSFVRFLRVESHYTQS